VLKPHLVGAFSGRREIRREIQAAAIAVHQEQSAGQPPREEIAGFRDDVQVIDANAQRVRCEFLFIAESRGFCKLVELIEETTIRPPCAIS